MLLYVVLYATVSYSLIFRTQSVLRLIAIGEEQVGSIDFTSHPYGPLAFSLMGTFVAISAFGHLLSILIKLVSQLMETGEYVGMFKQALLQNYLPGLTENIAKLIIGAALILGREKLGRLWRRMRPLAEKDNESGKD